MMIYKRSLLSFLLRNYKHGTAAADGKQHDVLEREFEEEY
jgi:hypothetical protein